jgi:hypothetical protein
MTTNMRYGARWTVNELLSLQREYELLNLDINEIALRHKRTPNAIMFKLDQEGLADYNDLYFKYHNTNVSGNNLNIVSLQEDEDEDEDEDYVPEDEDEDEDYVSEDEDYISEDDDDEFTDLKYRMSKLEENMDEIRNILKQMSKNPYHSIHY